MSEGQNSQLETNAESKIDWGAVTCELDEETTRYHLLVPNRQVARQICLKVAQYLSDNEMIPDFMPESISQILDKNDGFEQQLRLDPGQMSYCEDPQDEPPQLAEDDPSIDLSKEPLEVIFYMRYTDNEYEKRSWNNLKQAIEAVVTDPINKLRDSKKK